MTPDKSYEYWRICVIGGSRWDIVKGAIFQLGGCGNPQDDTRHKFLPDSKKSISGLSSEGAFVSGAKWKVVKLSKITKNLWLSKLIPVSVYFTEFLLYMFAVSVTPCGRGTSIGELSRERFIIYVRDITKGAPSLKYRKNNFAVGRSKKI